MKAPGLGRVHNPALAHREGWVRTTLRLFFNLAENKGTGLGTLRKYASKFTCTIWVTLQSLRTSMAGGLEHGAAGPLPSSYWAASFHRPGIRDPRGEGGCQ